MKEYFSKETQVELLMANAYINSTESDFITGVDIYLSLKNKIDCTSYLKYCYRQALAQGYLTIMEHLEEKVGIISINDTDYENCALVARQKGDVNTAIKCWIKVGKSDPIKKYGDDAVKNGKPEEAREIFLKYVTFIEEQAK